MSREGLAFFFSFLSAVAIGKDVLSERRFSQQALFAASSEGLILTVDGNAFELFDQQGRLLRSCSINDPRLEGPKNTVAVHRELALLSFFKGEAGKEESNTLTLVDLARCQVIATFSLPHVVMGLRGSSKGWLAVTHEVGKPEYGFFLVNNQGDLEASFEPPQGARESVTSRGLPVGPFSPIPFGDRVLLVSQSNYELWFPSQKGRSPRRLPNPECLEVEGQWLSGEDADRELRRRVAHATEETRRIVEEFLQKGGSHRGFMAAVKGVACYRDLLAVLLRDTTVPGGCRLDVWDLALEAPVAVTVIPEVPCPNRFFTLVQDGVWVFAENRLKKIPMVIPGGPLEKPCEALEQLRTTSLTPHPPRKTP